MSNLSKHRLRANTRTATTAALVVATLWATTSIGADDKVSTVISEQVKTEESARASQKRIEQLDTETAKMLGDYRQMTAEAQSLKSYNDELAVQVKSQQEQLQGMTQQLNEIQTTAREVLPMMNKMLDTLDQFVKLDLPFLADERAARIANLKDMMGRADVSTSEKYRRLVEAYQIEMEYGRTIESYQGKVNDKTVEFLRAGRVTIMYQTLDGKESGYWDADAKKWIVDNSYGDGVKAGIKIAKKQSAPDFLTVAIHAPKETT
jgi:chromosome segregation ATPase